MTRYYGDGDDEETDNECANDEIIWVTRLF